MVCRHQCIRLDRRWPIAFVLAQHTQEAPDDGLVVSGSEVGAVPIDEAQIVHKGKLGPGQMIAVDTATGRLFTNDELKEWLAAQAPYAAWVKQHLKNLELKIEHTEGPAASAANGGQQGRNSQFSILNSQFPTLK